MSLQLQQLETPRKSPVKGVWHDCKRPGQWKRDGHKLRGPNQSKQPINASPRRTPATGEWMLMRQSNFRAKKSCLVTSDILGKTDLLTSNELTWALADLGATDTVRFYPTSLSFPFPRGQKCYQWWEYLIPLTVSKSLPLSLQLGPVEDLHWFFLVPTVLIYLLGCCFLEIYQAHISISQSGGSTFGEIAG